jgi:hypothetical protein
MLNTCCPPLTFAPVYSFGPQARKCGHRRNRAFCASFFGLEWRKSSLHITTSRSGRVLGPRDQRASLRRSAALWWTRISAASCPEPFPPKPASWRPPVRDFRILSSSHAVLRIRSTALLSSNPRIRQRVRTQECEFRRCATCGRCRSDSKMTDVEYEH